jgi:hypothetical protein
MICGDESSEGRTKQKRKVATLNTDEISESFKKMEKVFPRKKVLGKFRQTAKIQVLDRIVHKTNVIIKTNPNFA